MDDALSTYEEQLDFILGEDGHLTEAATYDPSGDDERVIYGIFSRYTFQGSKDSGNVTQKKDGPRFVIADALDFDIYENKKIMIRNVEYTIEYMDRDYTGAQVLWLF